MASDDGLLTQDFATGSNEQDSRDASDTSPMEINFGDAYVDSGIFLPESNDASQSSRQSGKTRRKRRSGQRGGRSNRSKVARKPCCGCSRHSTCNRPPTLRQAGCTCVAKGRPCTNCDCRPGTCRNQTQLTAASGSLDSFLVGGPALAAPADTDPAERTEELDTDGLLTQPPDTTMTTAGSMSAELSGDEGDSGTADANSPGRNAVEVAATRDEGGRTAGGAPPPCPSPTRVAESHVEDGEPVQLCGDVAVGAEECSNDAEDGSVDGTVLLTQPEDEPAARQDLREPERAMPDPQDARTPAQDRPNGQPGAPLATEEGADLPGYCPTEADRLLDEVFGDHAHDNDGAHLGGGVVGDKTWQQRWLRMVQLNQPHYDLPKGKVGQRFLSMLVNEFRGVRERKWNSERVVVFITTVLRRTPSVKRACDVRARILQRLALWETGCFAALVDDTESEAMAGGARPSKDAEAEARAYDAQVLSGRLRRAVRRLTARDGGGVLSPDDLCSKAGKPVHEVLRDKHPPLADPLVGDENGAFEPYERCPVPVPLIATDETARRVASKLTGGAGPCGVDSVALQNWLIRFGAESRALREEMCHWANWLSNESLPWAAYRALRAALATALDKQPGTRPLGIGEIFMRYIAKISLALVGSQATIACGDNNLCAGLPAGIEGAVHAVQTVWERIRDAAPAPPAEPPDPPPRLPLPLRRTGSLSRRQETRRIRHRRNRRRPRRTRRQS